MPAVGTCSASHALLGLGLWLVPNKPEDVFARAQRIENGVDMDVQVSVRLADGAIGTFSGQGHELWGRRHACDIRVAGEQGVPMLDFDRAQAQLPLEADKERAEWLRSSRNPRGGAGRRAHLRRSCAVPRRRVPRSRSGQPCAPRRRDPDRRGDGGRLGVGALGPPGARRGSRERVSGELLVGAARLSLEPRSTCRSSARPADPRRDGLRQMGARDVGGRARAGRPAHRSLRRRHRRDRRAGDQRPVDRIAAATGADPAGVSSTGPHAPSVIGGDWGASAPAARAGREPGSGGSPTSSRTRSSRCARSRSSGSSRLVRSGAWGTPSSAQPPRASADGTTILGWNPDELVDNQVTSLQFRRPDESVVATVVNYGRHPVTTATTCTTIRPTSRARSATSCVAY